MAKLNLPPALDDHLIEGRARLELEFDQPYLLGPLFGDYDRHLVMIEDRLGVHINARGNRVMIEGEPDSAARAKDVLVGLYNRLDQGQDVDAAAVEEAPQADGGQDPDEHQHHDQFDGGEAALAARWSVGTASLCE